MKKFIRVDAKTMGANMATGAKDPPVIVRENGGDTFRCQNADVVLPDGTVVCSIRYRPDKPLSCGARCWIETTLEVKLEGAVLVT